MGAPSAVQAPSTAVFIFAALRPSTIIGRNSAAPAGAGMSWAAISLHWKIMSWGRTNGAARADRSRSAFILRVIHCAKRRSEEHTSELQSLMRISYAVFCLKKKTKIRTYEINKQVIQWKTQYRVNSKY